MKDYSDEIFTVVNEKDEIIEYRSRFECHHNPLIIHRAVDIVLFNKKGDVLMQKRSKQKDTFPGYYTVSASGHIDKGETYIQAAFREMEEELGIKKGSKIQLTQAGKYIVRLDNEAEMTELYKGEYEGEIIQALDEVESIHYFSKEQLRVMKNQITPGARVALQKLSIL